MRLTRCVWQNTSPSDTNSLYYRKSWMYAIPSRSSVPVGWRGPQYGQWWRSNCFERLTAIESTLKPCICGSSPRFPPRNARPLASPACTNQLSIPPLQLDIKGGIFPQDRRQLTDVSRPRRVTTRCAACKGTRRMYAQ